MIMRILSMGIVIALAASACVKADQPATTTTVTSTPTASERAKSAAQTANALAANPSAADSILKVNGYTQDSFQKLMYEIAADSAMSADYSAARVR
jgi:ABC-type glycerol-3-phosphate transport system substrate-binding protein